MLNKSTFATKKGLAQMLKGGVIMDVVTPEQAKIAEKAGEKNKQNKKTVVIFLKTPACKNMFYLFLV